MAVEQRVRFAEGRLVVEAPWSAPAAGLVLVNDEPVTGPWTTDAAGRPTAACGPWQVTVTTGAHGALGLTVANASDAPRNLATVTFARWAPAAFEPRLTAGGFREYVHGQSFLGIDAGAKVVGRKTPLLDHQVTGSLVTVFQQEGGAALLLGLLPPLGGAYSELVTLHPEPHLEGDFGCEIRHRFECRVDPGASVCTAPLVALTGTDGVALLTAYGALWRGATGRRLPARALVGWNSWDLYAGAVTRAAMDENLAAAGELFGDAVQVFAIDEGWERQWGDWDANGKFPEGLADFARHVRDAGRVPGIWSAPLLVNSYNPLYLERPDWFATQANGQPLIESYSYGPMAYLDPTQDEVLDHLRGIFRRLRAAGFDYFKVDFSHCILKAQRFRDPRVPRADLIRRAFGAIRGAIGDDAYLLSCGSPYESVVGLVDAVRSTGDIHIYWGHVVRNAANIAARWWMQGNLWNVDPDFLVVRGPETARPPYGRRQVVRPVGPDLGWVAGRELSASEAQAYALIIHLSGGDVFLGDALRLLKPNGVDLLRRVLQPRASTAVPVDLFTTEQDLPRVWISRGETDTLVGLFNWTDKPARLDFDPAAYGLRGTPLDFWTGGPVTALPARQARRSALALRYQG